MKNDFLNKLKIKELNQMQQQAIDLVRQNGRLLLISPTGSGKTIAFLLPLLESLSNKPNVIQALIIGPSRELVIQIDSVLKQMQTSYKVTVCYGGHKREIEENNLVQPPAVLIATPGRMGDHIRRRSVDLSQVNFVVVDEFDKCLELGFLEEMKFIFDSLPDQMHQMILTSATRMESLPDFVKMNDAVKLDRLPSHDVSKPALSVKTVFSADKDKLETLLKLVCHLKNTSSIIFCNHRESVERVSQFLKERKIINVFYHGGMEQIDRETALAKFKNGTAEVLVTTDLASRGLDIPDIRSIIHYHLPADETSFIHRNGRTARMHATGSVYLVYSQDEKIPEFVNQAEPLQLPDSCEIPAKPKWTTLFIAAGKKNKVNKIDIVGFLSKKGHLKKDDIGLIDVKDFSSFVAIRSSKIQELLERIKNEKIKNQKVKFAVAK